MIFNAFTSTMSNRNSNLLYCSRLLEANTIGAIEVVKQTVRAASLTERDVRNALRSLPVVMRQYLISSYSVKLDGIGSYTIIAKANNGRGIDLNA